MEGRPRHKEAERSLHLARTVNCQLSTVNSFLVCCGLRLRGFLGFARIVAFALDRGNLAAHRSQVRGKLPAMMHLMDFSAIPTLVTEITSTMGVHHCIPGRVREIILLSYERGSFALIY